MKKYKLNILFTCLCLPVFCFSQHDSSLYYAKHTNTIDNKGNILIDVGVGYSFYKPIVNGTAPFNGLSSSGNFPFSSRFLMNYSQGGAQIESASPVYHIGLDYFYASQELIGVSAGYQTWNTNYPVTSISNPTSGTGNQSRLNIIIAFTKNKSMDEGVDFYYSLRAGISYWSGIENIQASPYNGQATNNFNAIYPAFQCVLGMRVRLLSNIFLHLETGIGSPYAFEGGLTFLQADEKGKQVHHGANVYY